MKTKILMMFVSLFLIATLCGCSSSVSDQSEYSISEEMKAEEVSEIDLVDGDNGQGSSDEIEIDSSVDINRKIIKTGRLVIETKTFNETTQRIMNQVDEIGGFMQNCYIEGDQFDDYRGDRNARFSVRIPKDQFDQFMNNTQQYGNVTSKAIEGQDVTDQYFDTELHLETLETQRQQLNELLKQSGDLNDLFLIKQEIGNVTYEIERLRGTLNKYDSLIDFATVEIEVYERYEYKKQEEIPVTFGEKVKYQITTSFEGVIELIESVVLMVIALVPFMVVIGVPVAIILLIIIKLNKKNNKK